jgi:histidine ammonia-lyase
MSSFHSISADHLSLDLVDDILQNHRTIGLSPAASQAVQSCVDYLEQKIQGEEDLHYGINTGFGSLCNVAISKKDISQLQYNLLVSHAAGTGETVPPEIVRLMLLLKVQSLSYGHSGVRTEVIERLCSFFNLNILPEVFQLGSLGASGDLAPLAHLCLPMIGEGKVWSQNCWQSADLVLATLDWKPLEFQAKEALALLNGTQFSTAYGAFAALEGRKLLRLANLNAAIGYDAFDCRISPLHERIHEIRPHAGQIATARSIRALLEGSAISAAEKKQVQDPYAFRCVPQVHGATAAALRHVEEVLTTEINSVTDNPNIFPEEDLILSGGNFHAQPIALVLDYLAIALAELGSISERRVYQLISGQRGLPAFLTPNPGLHSGMMIAQYTAASIVSQNKQLCTPASADSIVSCNGQEDHVSMAANAGTKLYRVVQNVQRLLAIEFMVAQQALEFRRPLESSPIIEDWRTRYRQVVPKLEDDRIIQQDIQKTLEFLFQQQSASFAV